MRIWGYILIFLNIAAAAAFTVFATKVWHARNEWQFALLKQELVNRGLPVEDSPAPSDLDDDSVAFKFTFGPHNVEYIKKDRLKKLIPVGGEIFGDTGGPVASQTAETKRVEKIVFANLDAIKDPTEKRLRQMILLLNLSRGTQRDSQRQGAYALLRDLPDPLRKNRARREIAYLGRTTPQVAALTGLAGLTDVYDGFTRPADVTPEQQRIRVHLARLALAAWARSEVAYAAPDPFKSPSAQAPPAGEAPPKNENRDNLVAALEPLLKAVTGGDDPAGKFEEPNPATVETGKANVKKSISSEPGATLAGYIADVGGNLLNSEAEVLDAKKKLLEVMHLRSRTDAETKSLTALADLIIPPKPSLGMNATQEEINQAISTQFAKNVDAAATESLRAFFEEATAATSDNEKDKLPGDLAQARAKLAGTKILRDPDEKRRNIAHLLYHLDSNLGGNLETRTAWYKYFVRPGSEEEAEFKFPAADEAMLKNRAAWHARVAAIVGLEAYAAAAEAQANNLNQIAQLLRSQIFDEQSNFEKEYQDIVQATIALAIDWGVRVAQVNEIRELRNRNNQQLMDRLAEQTKYENQLKVVTAAAKAATDKLALKVNELFQITKQLGEAQDALIGLEVQLREMELGKPMKK
jgi:hypothetical protein